MYVVKHFVFGIQSGKVCGLNVFSAYREVTINLVRRAEKAGFKALVLTVDTPFFGLRLADIRNKFVLPPHLKYKNYLTNFLYSIN